MENNWIPSKLSDVVDIHTGKVSVDEAKLADYISTDNLIPDFGGVIAAVKMPATGKVTNYKIGDVLFSNIRTYFKKLWLANKNGTCSNDVIVFRPKNGIQSEYIYHLLMNQEFIEYTVKTSKGTKMPRGDKEAIMKYEFFLAPKPERINIGNSLICYKDKIEINHQINQTLEQMAQALFKSWFVDFDPVIDNALDAGNSIPEDLQAKVEQRKAVKADNKLKPLPDEIRQLFPSEFEESELGWVPKGWEVSELGEFIKFANGKAMKSSDEGVYPIYGANGIIGKTSEVKFRNAIIVGRVGAYCGAIEYCRDDFWASDNTIVATSKESEKNIPYILYQLKYLNLNQYAGGAAQPLLNQTTLNKLKVSLPDVECSTCFNNIVDDILLKNVENNKQTVSLSKLRDTVLPKLISGELQIN